MNVLRSCAQPSLYEFDTTQPQVGSVVQQLRPLAGHCQLIAPFWVVFSINYASENFRYLCFGLPFGHWPDERHWFAADDLKLVGFNIPVPSDLELEQSFKRAGRHNPFAARLCRNADGTRFVSQWDWERFEPDPKPEPLRCLVSPRGYYVPLSLVDLDAPVVSELTSRGLPWRAGEVTRQNFYQVLP